MPVYLAAKRAFRTYYVVFQNSSFHRPWQIFTWNGYKHCWVFFPKFMGPPGLMTRQTTIKVESLSTFLDIDHWSCEPEEIASEFIKQDYILDIVKISLPLPSNLSYNIRGLINCVTIVKSVMGLSKFVIMTPQQLRRYLLKIGGRSLKNGSNTQLNFWRRTTPT